MPRRKRSQAPGPDQVPLPPFADRLPLSGDAERSALLAALEEEPPVSIRLNPRKPFPIEAEPVPWCATGRYLPARPAFTLDPLLHAGAYYVQEASSMLLEQAVRAAGAEGRGALALDLCAAPGGKSTHLLALLGPGSLLVANEAHPERRRALAENCWKHGAPNVLVSGSPAAHLAALPGTFDLIVLDAPCSGQGMFRKDGHARRQWSPGLVRQCAATQQGLATLAWDALAPGGTLIYSTCTWEAEEDEARVAELLRYGGECLELPVQPAWGVERSTRHGTLAYRCYPHRMRGEGFFIAAVRKPGQHREHSPHAGSAAAEHVPWLDPQAGMEAVRHGDLLVARPRAWGGAIERIHGALALEAPGIPFAQRRGPDRVPHAAAAHSLALRRDWCTEVPLDLAGALRYLRGEALPATAAEGAALATYEGHALGWLQGAGNRWNNRWPPHWRIRIQESAAPAVPWSFA